MPQYQATTFTGDLTAPEYIGMEDPNVIRRSWQLLGERGAKTVYPGHGPVRRMVI